MKKIFTYLISVTLFLFAFFNLNAQTNYFVDGYHGGVYGHYPLWVTKFITDTLQHYKDWKINLEIEPETWDTVALKDPVNYAAFKKLIDDSSLENQVEYVNPSYAQSYLYNISGESIIRQFQYGMKKLKEHFPSIKFTTYSSEEPCFTSALPQILKSLGFKYAVLKNPNTCWGGYVKAFGGESVNWVGPDGSNILTVPRYTSESLQKKSTWQTTAWNNSKSYLNAATDQGIKYPVGMCLQDAGWKNGPWLDNHKLSSTQYTTWRNYFEIIKNDPAVDWRLSQEDIDVSLVWGAQILQQIAQEVRAAENKILMAEKAAAMAKLYAGIPYPERKFDEAWRTLLLSEHHDCWIVPYNMHDGKTWADNVKIWTDYTINTCDSILQQSLSVLNNFKPANDNKKILVFNSTAVSRNEVVEVKLPKNVSNNISIKDDNKTISSQVITNEDLSQTLLFKAEIPALGYKAFSISHKTYKDNQNTAYVNKKNDGTFAMETDLYKIIINENYGGSIKHFIAKKLDNKDFIAPGESSGFNTLRGNFYNDGGLKTSAQSKKKITILENGPLRIKLQIEGMIDQNNFIQTIQLTQGQKLIDCFLHIDYAKHTGIGENYKQQGGYYSTELHKAFYNDTDKLMITFPLSLKHQKIYKDAPLDVTESKHSNTFYNTWDSIKNNVIDNWVDVTDEGNNYGMALFTDHVTSYSHGENFPLALTVQYSGVGLWGRNYSIDKSTDIHYALLPHKNKWNDAGINNENIKWNEPLTTSIINKQASSNSFIKSIDSGLTITTMYYKDDALFIRIVNNGSGKNNHTIELNCYADKVEFTELNGVVTSSLQMQKKKTISFDCNIPLFGFKTIKLVNPKPVIINNGSN
ncbi:MAG: glycoside hydrolase family 38 C-terminal domain-containing protein [Parafilimonas sp.]